jgi:hypothetical protein
MSMERSRRDRFATQPVPVTWEVPAVVTLVVLFLLVLTPVVVQGLMAWLVSGTFAWPGDLGQALLGLLRGRFGEGLAPRPSDALLWVLAAVGEFFVLGAALVVGVWMRELVAGGNARHGLATSVQAAQALGLTRLRRSAAVIRPDLYARHARQGRPGQRGRS